MVVLALSDPIEHVLDVYLLKIGQTPVLTMNMVTLILSAGLLIVVMTLAARAIATGPASQGNERYFSRGRLGQMVEAITVYLRDDMLTPVMGEKTTRAFLPFLLTVFFFILFNNLLGMIPLLDIQHLAGIHTTAIGGTATGNLNITAGLATIAFVLIVAHGFRELGVKGFLEHMTGGLTKEHWALWAVIPILFLVELAGLFIKPAALAIRLFANMVAGHTLMAVLVGFGLMALEGGMSTLGTGTIALISGVAAVLITFLELFVAFLQAFIFMFLTAVFISLMSHEAAEEEHEAAEARAHAH